MENHCIAIADDHFYYREAIAELLKTYGFNVVISVADGKELLDRLDKSSILPEVCILDLNMPVKDGFETAKVIKRRWAPVKILALSVNSDKYRQDRVFKSGADAILNKNTHPEILRKTLLDLCQSA